MSRHRQALYVLISFLAGAAFAVFVPRLVRAVGDRLIFPADRREAARSTSPDGIVDAVTEVIECGAPCSTRYAVSVVPRGAPPSRDPVRLALMADDMVNTKARWKEPHLLEVVYDRALILSFRNVAYPFAREGDIKSWDYAVEIRLTPSSGNFSYLSPGNDPKPAHQ